MRSSASLQSISSIRSTGSGSSWFSVNSLSSFQCAGLDRNHNNKPRVSGISINDNLDICFPQLVRPCCQTVQTFVKLFNRASSLFKILNPTLMLYCDPHSENYSFDVVKFAYLTMPRITQCCWPYSIIYALIISPRNTFQPHSLLSSGSRHRLSVGSGKSLKQSISSPAISDIIKSKVGDTLAMGYGIIMLICSGPSEQPIC